MDNRVRLAASSRDGHLALRRVERQQELIERLHSARGERIQIGELARHFGVSDRTIARDVERLRLSGVPLTVRQGRGGGISLAHSGGAIPIVFDMPEVAALMSSLAVLGPSVSQSAASAMRKLSESLDPAHQASGSRAAVARHAISGR
ncbi:MAG TPA: HTH domain-containing protein [Acidimicrobiia bacterium]|nr:HTH domain-containing protein [Acidimicrobiia bacterium]